VTPETIHIPDHVRLRLDADRAAIRRNTATAGPAPLTLRKGTITARDGAARTVTVLLGASDLSDVPADPIGGCRVMPHVYPRVGDACWVGGMPVPCVYLSEGPPGRCKARRTSDLAVSSGGTEPGALVDLDADVEDNDGLHDPVTNNWRITFGWPGWWAFSGAAEWAAGQTAGFRSLAVRRNGPSGLKTLRRKREYQGHAAIGHGQDVTGGRSFVAGDWIELMAYQNSGAPISLQALDEDSLVLEAWWVGPA
jgi:hypothetical protein